MVDNDKGFVLGIQGGIKIRKVTFDVTFDEEEIVSFMGFRKCQNIVCIL